MTERPRDQGGTTDAELGVRGIVGFGIGLAVLIAITLALVWLLSARLKSVEVARDPEPSPLAEVHARRLPPEPRLQSAPVADMKTLRAHENEVLDGYGSPDRATGTARIPIDRAIAILAERGLPEPHPAPGGQAPDPKKPAEPAMGTPPGTAAKAPDAAATPPGAAAKAPDAAVRKSGAGGAR